MRDFIKISGEKAIQLQNKCKDGIVQGMNVLNFVNYTKLRSDKIKGKQTFEQFLRSYNHLFLKNNVKELTQIFGKHSLTFKGEYLFKVWVIQFKNRTFAIYSNKEYGTTIEILSDKYISIKDKKTNKIIIAFTKKLYKLLLSPLFKLPK